MVVTLRHTYAHWFFSFKKLRFSVKKKTKLYQLKLATQYNELTAKQLLALHKARYNIGILEIHCLMQLMYNSKLALKLYHLNVLNYEVAHTLLPYTEFLFNNESTLTKNLLPKIKGLYGPEDCCYNLTADEYAHTAQFYRDYQATKNAEHLNKLIAVLYRKPKWFLFIKKHLSTYNGDPRQDFNPNHLQANAKRIAKWPDEVKHAILLFYAGCENHMALMHPVLFEKSNSKNTTPANWGAVIINMAGSKFGTVAQTGKTYAYTLLFYLNQEAIKATQNNK